jgi:hypothetical protein
MPTPSASERRRLPRITVLLPCKLRVSPTRKDSELADGEMGVERIILPEDMAGESLTGSVIDLSESGARLTANKIPVLLSRVELEFEMPDFGPATALGLVLWRSRVTVPVKLRDGKVLNPAFGVLFEVAAVDLRAHIAELIRKAPPPSSGKALLPW